MTTISKDTSIASYYFDFLKNLNPDSKLDLISKLSQSLREDTTVSNTTLESLFGAYKSEETAEEIIANIKAS